MHFTRHTRLFSAIVRRIRTHAFAEQFIETNRPKEEKTGWRRMHANAPRSHVMRIEVR